MSDDPAHYELRVAGHGMFPFRSTEEPTQREFGTAIAVADGLRADWQYRYQVLQRGRVVPRGRGTFRTMPAPGSLAEILFCSLSCSHRSQDGAWRLLESYIKDAKPRFLLMTGDQIYLDQGENVWDRHLHSSGRERRDAMVLAYQDHWSREPIRTIMANIPTYMVWDDHDIRDGWGSWAGDSPTLAVRYPRGATIGSTYERYFEDARAIYLHFQFSHNPVEQPGLLSVEPGTTRRAFPYWFRCGRLCVIVLDGRGARDLWRADYPVLGSSQWQFINEFLSTLPSDVDALAVVTPVPIVAMSPNALAQKILGERTDDVELFAKGRAKELLKLQKGVDDSTFEASKAVVAEYVPIASRRISDYKLGDLDDVRDQWSHHLSQSEQARLIRAVGNSTLTQRLHSQPREAVFLGGDIHVGATFMIRATRPDFDAQCLVSSSIAQNVPGELEAYIAIIGEESFQVGEGLRAKLEGFVRANNFGITQVIFNGATARIANTLAHEGTSDHWTLRLPPSV